MPDSLTPLTTSVAVGHTCHVDKSVDCLSPPRNEVFEAIAKRFKNLSRSLGSKRAQSSARSPGSVRKGKGESLTFTCLGLPPDTLVPDTKHVPETTTVELQDVCKASGALARRAECRMETTGVDATWTTKATYVRSKGPAHSALQSVFESLAPPAIALNVSRGLEGTSLIQQGRRSEHIQLSPALQRDLPGNTKQLQSRLLFVCACMSLAQDLQAYERRQAHQHEQDRTEASGPHQRLLPSAASGQGQTFQRFVASEARNGVNEKQVIIALNFGEKLQIIEAISNSLGLGGGLAVLLGYECVSLSQLTYRAIAMLRREIGPDADMCGRIKAFSAVVDTTWREFRENYHRDHCQFVEQDVDDGGSTSDNVSIIIAAPNRRSLSGQNMYRHLPPMCRRPSQRFSAPIIFLDAPRLSGRRVAQDSAAASPCCVVEEIPATPAHMEIPTKAIQEARQCLETPAPVMQRRASLDTKRLRSTYFWGNAGELGLYTHFWGNDFEDSQSLVQTDTRRTGASYLSMVQAAAQLRRKRKVVGEPGSGRRDGRIFMLAPMSSAKRKRDASYFWDNMTSHVATQNATAETPAFPAIQLSGNEPSHEASWTETSSADTVDDALEGLMRTLRSRSGTSVVLEAAEAHSMKRQRRPTNTVGVAR